MLTNSKGDLAVSPFLEDFQLKGETEPLLIAAIDGLRIDARNIRAILDDFDSAAMAQGARLDDHERLLTLIGARLETLRDELLGELRSVIAQQQLPALGLPPSHPDAAPKDCQYPAGRSDAG
jgi:hypothetical protein